MEHIQAVAVPEQPGEHILVTVVAAAKIQLQYYIKSDQHSWKILITELEVKSLQTLYALIPGDFFSCSWQFNLYVGILVVSILARSPEKRHAVFKWLITILTSVSVVSGTMLRIGWGVWQDIDIGLGKNRVERYFILSLASWIGCIIMDGYLILNIFRAYHGRMKKLVWDFCTNWTAVQTAEKVGLLISLATMINLGIDVYCSFNNLTTDVSLYVYFTLCVMCKIGRILVQGKDATS